MIISKLDYVKTIKKSPQQNGPPQSFKHVGLKITRLTNGGIKISNPKTVGLIFEGESPERVKPYMCAIIHQCGPTARKYREAAVNIRQYMNEVGSLRFVADITHPGISHIVGVLGRHLHNLLQSHVDALKPLY